MSGPDQTPQMPNDRELEEFLGGRGKVRETYHLNAQEKPPALVDDAILRMAEQAVSEPASVVVAKAKPPVMRRWQGSIAAAAVLVLSFGVLLQVRQDPVARQAVLPTPEPAVPSAPPVSKEIMLQKPKKLEQAAATAKYQALEQAEQAEQSERKKSEAKEDQLASAGVSAMASPRVSGAVQAPAVSDAQAKPEAEADRVRESAPASVAMQDAQEPATAMAKSTRSAAMMAPAPVAAAPAPMPSAEAQIDQWLQTCSIEAVAGLDRDDAGLFKQPQVWRGLAVSGIADGALMFGPKVTRTAIAAQLNTAGSAASACLKPAANQQGWQLLCGCTR